jgi:hypothetical protein
VTPYFYIPNQGSTAETSSQRLERRTLWPHPLG